MKYTLVRSKLHRATVTGGDLNYAGSITIGRNLMLEAGLIPFELVHINNMSNAVHWETYVIPGDDREIILNGAPARLFQPGDRITVLALAELTQAEMAEFRQTVVTLDEKNQTVDVEERSLAEWFVYKH